jgi:hypothetical protein
MTVAARIVPTHAVVVKRIALNAYGKRELIRIDRMAD